jgi:hypothetical protein
MQLNVRLHDLGEPFFFDNDAIRAWEQTRNVIETAFVRPREVSNIGAHVDGGNPCSGHGVPLGISNSSTNRGRLRLRETKDRAKDHQHNGDSCKPQRKGHLHLRESELF